jgi:hypothetical protein
MNKAVSSIPSTEKKKNTSEFVTKLQLTDTHSMPATTISTATSSPAHVGDGDPFARPHLHPIFVPLSCHLLIRHLTLEHRLFRGLHSEVGNALQDLKLFLWMERKGAEAMATPVRL